MDKKEIDEMMRSIFSSAALGEQPVDDFEGWEDVSKNMEALEDINLEAMYDTGQALIMLAAGIIELNNKINMVRAHQKLHCRAEVALMDGMVAVANQASLNAKVLDTIREAIHAVAERKRREDNDKQNPLKN